MHLLIRKRLTRKFNQFSKENRGHFIRAIEKYNQTMNTNVMQHLNNN